MNTLKKYAGPSTNGTTGEKNMKEGDDVSNVKNRLLNVEKNLAAEKNDGFIKKSIGEKKGLNSFNFEEEKKNNEKINHLTKFQQSNEDLLKKLNVVSEEKTNNKEEQEKNIVKIFKKLPSNDKNMIEIDNTRFNLLLMEHKK